MWKIGTHEWDTFNIADAALVVGIIGLIVDGGDWSFGRKKARASG